MVSPAERRLGARRAPSDRRSGAERRQGEQRDVIRVVVVDGRAGADRREGDERRQGERRSGSERRGEESAAEHIHDALQRLTHLAESGALDDERRRDLDAAIFRLRFALERLKPDGS